MSLSQIIFTLSLISEIIAMLHWFPYYVFRESIIKNLNTYATSQKKSSAISSGIVGQTNFDTVAGKLVAVGSGHDPVSLKTSVGDLTTNVLVGGPHD